MNLDYWMHQRTEMIRLFYDKARVPFEQLKRDIEEGVRPWEPPPFNPDTDDGEPAFLEEWMQAEQTRELVGMLAVSLLADTLTLYFAELERELRIKFVDQSEKKTLFKLGKVEAYRQILRHVMGDVFEQCPVRFEVIEQVILARNDFAHNSSFISFQASHNEKTLEKHPNPFFIRASEQNADERWGDLQIEVSRENLFEAIEEVEKLARWIDQNEDSIRAWWSNAPEKRAEE